MHGLLHDIAVSLIAATVVGVLMERLRQPSIVGYLLTGVIIGPEIGAPLVRDAANIEVISEIGLVLLLFVIGLEMNPRHLVASGRRLVYAGVGQFLFTALLGLAFFGVVGTGAGGGRLDALYLALLCSLSSTAIVVKALYDKVELDTLSGRMTVGILIFQDLWAILVLAVQPSFQDPHLMPIVFAVLKSAALLAASLVFSRYVLQRVFAWNTRSPEMVVAISIGWCAAAAALGQTIGLSLEMGALVAGLAISSFPYSIHVTAQLLPLRDVFLTLYFISLGMKIPAPDPALAVPVLAAVAFIFASRFLTVYPLARAGGSGPRTSFLASLNLSQMSEFSLVIASLGLEYGHVSRSVLSIALYTMAATALISSYLIKYNHEIYERMAWRRGARRTDRGEDRGAGQERPRRIVILGFHRAGRLLVDTLARERPQLLGDVLVVDFSVEVLRPLEAMGIRTTFGDIGRSETLRHAGIEHAQVVIQTIPDMLLRGTDNMRIVRACRELAPRAFIVATADLPEEADALRTAGANQVILPYSLAAEHLASRLVPMCDGLDPVPAGSPGHHP